MQYSMKYELSLVYKWFHSGTLLSAMWLTQKPGDCKGDVFCHKTRDARRKAPTQLVLGRTRRGWAATSSHTCNVNPYPASFTQNINKYACSALHCKTCVLTKFWFLHDFLKSWNRGCIFLIWIDLNTWNLQLQCSVDISSLDNYSIYIYTILQVSVMTKLVPSPDWFIGLDSLDLCSQGAFVESVVTEVGLLMLELSTGLREIWNI